MMKTHEWNPSGYLQFKRERTQPAIDLVNRIDCPHAARIVDIGCGPGNSTEILLNRWPKSSLWGIDNSPAMIDAAQTSYPDQRWEVADGANFSSAEGFDLIFSNAALQWLPDHETLLNRWMDMVNAGGAVAVQMPLYQLMPLSSLIDNLYQKVRGASDPFTLQSVFTFHESRFYNDLLASRTSRLDIWETSYLHPMASHEKIVEMIRTTGMKPYLERMESESERRRFEAEVLRGVEEIYPKSPKGNILFPFKRLFMVAYR